jgi:hypothetical protein
MKLDRIIGVFTEGIKEYALLGKDQQLATWAMMNGEQLLAIAKEAECLLEFRRKNLDKNIPETYLMNLSRAFNHEAEKE